LRPRLHAKHRRFGGRRRLEGVRFGTIAVSLADLRDAARAHRVSVTDVLLSATAGALSRLLDPLPPTVRVEVPVTMRVPGAHIDGNATGAVMIELPWIACPNPTAPSTEVYPVVPSAPRVPLAVGSLSWDGTIFLGVSIDRALIDADGFTAAFRAILADLLSAGVPQHRGVDK
jgi:hypothetical protein